MHLILASQSPRRRELLALLDHPFSIQVADVDETMDTSLSVEQAVADISRRKACAISAEPQAVVVGADTVVVLDSQVLGKPKNPEDAYRMLRALSGKTHRVMTGLCVRKGSTVITHTEVTKVHFRELTEKEIAAYIATGEPMDKAGAYGIQGGAAPFISGIEGDYYNVVGLPVCRLGMILREIMEETV